MEKDRDYKKEMFDRISEDLRTRAQQIHEDPEIDVKDQLTQMDIVWNIFKFLDHYDENIQVLESYRQKKEARKRRMQGKDVTD